MLSGDGNENGEKTTIGLINKKQLFTCSTLYCTFLCPCFARLQRETYVFSLTFFSLPFICALVAVSISYFLTAATNFSCWLSFLSFVFLSLGLALCRSFSG